MRRTVIAVLLLLAPAALFAGWKKPYFTATKAGTWVKYTTHSTVGDMSTTMTRLPDQEGQQRIETKVEFAKPEMGTSSVLQYSLRKGFSLENDGMDYMQALVAGEVFVGDSTEPQAFAPEMIANIVKATEPYVLHVVYKDSASINGRECDHYTFTIKHAGDPPVVESGDLWMSSEVPFGLVRQKATLIESNGTVRDTFEQNLVNWGTK